MTKARYAKNMMLVRVRRETHGMKNRAARLCDHLRGRWTNREKGYVMSRCKVEKLKALYTAGWDAAFITAELIPPSVEKGKRC